MNSCVSPTVAGKWNSWDTDPPMTPASAETSCHREGKGNRLTVPVNKNAECMKKKTSSWLQGDK